MVAHVEIDCDVKSNLLRCHREVGRAFSPSEGRLDSSSNLWRGEFLLQGEFSRELRGEEVAGEFFGLNAEGSAGGSKKSEEFCQFWHLFLCCFFYNCNFYFCFPKALGSNLYECQQVT